MTRKELIKQAAEQFADREHGTMRDVSVFNLLQYAFKCGAEWANKHPDLSKVWHPYLEMTREEQILSAAREYNSGIIFSSPSNVLHFEAGAHWADEHPINVWHKPSEKPQGDSEILFDGLAYAIIYDLEAFLDKLEIDWEELVEGHYIQRWAYISDLLPKGGER